MTRWFNTAGPCNPAKHYTLSPTERLPQLARLIEQESYFVLHAPRPTGQTTLVVFDQRSRQPPIADRTPIERVLSPQTREIIVVHA